MGQPAARVGDMHVCPMVTPGTPPVPHVGGPVLPPGGITVLIGGQPAARMGDMCTCVGPPDAIVQGAPTVLICGQPAARMGDLTSHGGSLSMGFPTVLIGTAGGGGGAPVVAAPVSAVASGLGADIDKLAAKSPTLEGKLKQLQKDKWTIKYGPKGKGTYANKAKKQIVIDSNKKGNPAAVVASLAHEAGHATYQEDPYVVPKGKTREEYVKQNANRHLKDEGEATLTSIEVRDEIKSNGGPDIGVPGTQRKKYEAIKKKYPDPKDRDKARQEIGDVFANHERPSTDPKKTYKDYYRKTYEEYYDKHVKKPK